MAKLVRIFAAEDGTTIGDISHAAAAPWPDIIIEVEASQTECAAGSNYRVGGFARDYLSGNVAALVPGADVVDDGDVCRAGEWPTRNHEFQFELPAAVTGVAAAGGIVELVAFVSTGRAGPGADADMDTGAFTWVTPPP